MERAADAGRKVRRFTEARPKRMVALIRFGVLRALGAGGRRERRGMKSMKRSAPGEGREVLFGAGDDVAVGSDGMEEEKEVGEERDADLRNLTREKGRR